MFENKLIRWFLPGLKTQANAKTEGTQEKAIVILGGAILYEHISSGFTRKQEVFPDKLGALLP